MNKQKALDLLRGLAEQGTNRLAAWGISQVHMEIVECPNSDGLHVRVSEEDTPIVEFHIWDPEDDFPEGLYDAAFKQLCASIYMAEKTYEAMMQMLNQHNPFEEFKPPWHNGALN